MKAREIPQLLQYFGLPNDSVAIGGIGYDRWCIAEAEEGKWEVYYFDRGEKIKHYVLPDERGLHVSSRQPRSSSSNEETSYSGLAVVTTVYRRWRVRMASARGILGDRAEV